jgi:hypothetical protein
VIDSRSALSSFTTSGNVSVAVSRSQQVAPKISIAASSSVLPCSAVSSRFSSPVWASMASAMSTRSCRRSAMGRADQAGNAARAAATAWSSCSGEQSGA